MMKLPKVKAVLFNGFNGGNGTIVTLSVSPESTF